MSCIVNSLAHIGVQVSDMDRSLKFYREVLGLKLTGRWGPPDYPGQICFMRIDQMHHNVVLFGLPEGTDENPPSVGIDTTERKDVGLNHVAFQVDKREDWLLALDHVRSMGVELVFGPYVHGHEAQDEKGFIGGSGSHAFYFLDPDGNRLEIYCWMMSVSKPSVAAPVPDL